MVVDAGNSARPGVRPDMSETNIQQVSSGRDQNLVVAHGCNTISALFEQRVRELSEKVALREKDYGIWNEYTWQQYGQYARWVGYGLKALGLQRGDVCSIASEVNKEWMFSDMGKEMCYEVRDEKNSGCLDFVLLLSRCCCSS